MRKSQNIRSTDALEWCGGFFKTACFGTQGIMWPQVVSGAMGNVVNAIINYIFLSLLDLGVA